MTTNQPVLVAYDGSEDAERALIWAAHESVRTGSPLRVVTIDDVSSSPWGGEIWVRDPEMVAHAEAVLGDLGVEDGVVERRVGNVASTLLDLSESASLVVLGSNGRGRVPETFLGSVSQHVARHAVCPVVVVRPPRRPDAGRIVVGLDGSAMSEAALDYACRRAEGTGEVVVAIHGWKVHTPSTDVFSSTARSVTDTLEEKQVLLGESVAGMRGAYPDVVVVTEAIPVAPGDALVDASSNASLVVVGSRGRGFFSGLLLGSVSQDVLHRAHCPVAIVR
jgi:nucleotide-binding universal stress UspA family protein